MDKQKDKTLITGATGLLGSHLLYSLLSDNQPVRALKRSTSKLDEVKKVFSYYTNEPEDLFSRIEWIDADILDIASLYEAMEGISRVYHAAAFVSFNPKEKVKLINNNLSGTANVVNVCLEMNVEKLLHVSSTSALGNAAPGQLVTEDMIWSPDKLNTGYSISKFKSEMEVWRGMEEGLNAVIVNPSIIFGPGFWHKGSSSMFTNIHKGLKYYMNGVTGYVGVKDVVSCMMRLMDSDISGERFIISSENLSYHEVFTLIARALNVPTPSRLATPLLAGAAWRLDAFRGFFGVPRVITRETVMAGNNISRFSNEKIKKTLGTEFQKINEVVKWTAAYFPETRTGNLDK